MTFSSIVTDDELDETCGKDSIRYRCPVVPDTVVMQLPLIVRPDDADDELLFWPGGQPPLLPPLPPFELSVGDDSNESGNRGAA